MRFLWWAKLVEGVGFVRIEIVEQHPDAIGIRIAHINKCLYLLDELLFPAAFGDFDMSLADE